MLCKAGDGAAATTMADAGTILLFFSAVDSNAVKRVSIMNA
jgi:hypothetical protein